MGSGSVIKICFVGYKSFHLAFILNCLLSFTMFLVSSFEILKSFLIICDKLRSGHTDLKGHFEFYIFSRMFSPMESGGRLNNRRRFLKSLKNIEKVNGL